MSIKAISTLALLVPYAIATTTNQQSFFAGESTSAVFPVLNATNAALEFDSFFPAATVVGFAGATPSKSLLLSTTREL